MTQSRHTRNECRMFNEENISDDFRPGIDEDAIVRIQFRMRRMMRASLPILFSLSFR